MSRFVVFGTVEMNWRIEVESENAVEAARSALGHAADGSGLDSHAGLLEVTTVYVVNDKGLLDEVDNPNNGWPEGDDDSEEPEPDNGW